MTRSVIEVVDDNEDIRRMLALVLQSRGHVVRQHASAQAYLQAEPSSPPHAMLLDMRMPDMTGLELLAQMKARGDTIPVIFMSGESQAHETDQITAGDALDFLWKPFGTQQLLQSLERALGTAAKTRSD